MNKKAHMTSHWRAARQSIFRKFRCHCVGRTGVLLAGLLAAPASGFAQQEATTPLSSEGDSVPAPATEVAPAIEPERPGIAPGRVVQAEEPQTPAAGTPYQMGSFLVYPEIDVTELYDSNVYFTNSNPLSDHAMIYSPAIWVQSNWAQHALNFHAGGDATRYSRYTAENSDDYHVSAEGRYDLTADRNLYGGARFSRNHEDRESPDARNGLTPTLYTQRQYYGGFFNQVGRWSFRVAGTSQQLNYDDVNFLTGGGVVNVINNDDRDRWQYAGGVRVAYESSLPLEWYAQAAIDDRRYNNAVDDLGYERDSDGRRYLVGVKWNVPKTLKLDAFAGRLQQNYKDPRAQDIGAPLGGGSLLWSISDRTTMSAYVDRTVEETTVTRTLAPGVVQVANSYLNTYFFAGLSHRLLETVTIRVGGSLSHVGYEGLDRNDNYYSANIGAAYRIQRNLVLDVELSDRKLNSSIPTEDFTKRTIFVRLALPFSH